MSARVNGWFFEFFHRLAWPSNDPWDSETDYDENREEDTRDKGDEP